MRFYGPWRNGDENASGRRDIYRAVVPRALFKRIPRDFRDFRSDGRMIEAGGRDGLESRVAFSR